MLATACSSAAVCSGAASFRKLPPPISGPARYLSRPGLRSGGCISTWKWNPGWGDPSVGAWCSTMTYGNAMRQVVQANQRLSQHGREVRELGGREVRQGGARRPRGHERLVRVAGEIRNEGDRLVAANEQ